MPIFDPFKPAAPTQQGGIVDPFAQGYEPQKEQDNALTRGIDRAKSSAAITSNLTTGNYADAARNIAEADAYQRANPGTPEGNELSAAWNRGSGIMGGIKEVAGEFAKDWSEAPSTMGKLRATGKNLSAMGGGIVEQLPNMVAPMGGMIAGGATGALAGSAVPVVGNVAGGVAGAWAGASAGNTLMEGGEQVTRALQKAGIDPQNRAAVEAYLAQNGDTVLGQAATKGAIIGAVDTATMGIGGKLLTAPAKAATNRALAEMGVDVADKAAVKAAMKTPEIAKQVGERMAADAQFQAATTGARGLARNATVAGLEPAGEFAGEYFGQGVATGDYDAKDAFLEAVSSLGQSGATFAGQKAYQAITNPARGVPPGPLARAAATADASGATANVMQNTVQAQAGQEAAPADPYADRMAQVASMVEDRELLRALRGDGRFGKESVTELLGAWAVARNPQTDPALRERALAGIEQFLSPLVGPGVFGGQQNFTMPPNEPDAFVRDPQTGLVPAGEQAVANPAQPAFDPNTLDGQAREVGTLPRQMLEGPRDGQADPRRALLDSILADPETKNPLPRYESLLKKNGFEQRRATPEERKLIEDRTVSKTETARAELPPFGAVDRAIMDSGITRDNPQRPAFPLSREGAERQAAKRQQETGEAFAVVPHPTVKGRFAVQPVAAANTSPERVAETPKIEHEQPTNALLNSGEISTPAKSRQAELRAKMEANQATSDEIDEYVRLIDQEFPVRLSGGKPQANQWFETPERARAYLTERGYQERNGAFEKDGEPRVRAQPASLGRGGVALELDEFAPDVEDGIAEAAKLAGRTEKEARSIYRNMVEKNGKEYVDDLLRKTVEKFRTQGTLNETPAEAQQAAPQRQAQPAAATAEGVADFEHNGTRIYPMSVRVGSEAKQMWGTESAENRAKRLAGERYGFGDSLHDTPEQARAAADRERKDAADRAEYASKQEQSRASQQAEETARKADTINGFIADKSPMQAGKIRESLAKQFRFEGVGVRSVREHVDALLADGKLEVSTYEEPKIKPMSRTQFNRASQREQDAHEKKMREAGNKTVYLVGGSDLGKTAYDYAQHLLSRNANAPEPTQTLPEDRQASRPQAEAQGAQESGQGVDSRRAAIDAETMEDRPDAPEVAQPIAGKRVRVLTHTLSGEKSVNAKLYEMPGYKGPQLAVAEYKSPRGTGYRVYLPKSGAFITDSNGVGTLEDTLKLAVARIKNARETISARNKKTEAQSKPRSELDTVAERITEPATHADAGRQPEAATAPVIREAIQKSARNTEFNAKEAKAWLLAEIDRAIADAPADGVMEGVTITGPVTNRGKKEWTATRDIDVQGTTLSARLAIRQADGGFVVGERFGTTVYARSPNLELASEDAARLLHSAEWKTGTKANGAFVFDTKALEQKEFVTFDVPGDGTFRVVNAPRNLQAFRDKVETSPGFRANPVVKPNFGTGNAQGPSLDETLKQLGNTPEALAEIGNAIEIARLKKAKDEDKLLDRFREASGGKEYDAWRAEQEAEAEIERKDAEAEQSDPDSAGTVAQNEVESAFAQYDDVAKEYGRQVDADGTILNGKGADSGVRIVVKKGRMRIESKKGGNLLFSGAGPESLGQFLERFWIAEKKKPGQPAPAESAAPQAPQAKAADDAQFSKDATDTGTTPDAIWSAIRELVGPFRNKRIVVVQSADVLVEQGILQSRDARGAQAFVKDGKAYFIASNIQPGNERAVFLHEVGAHLGMESILSPLQRSVLVTRIKTWAAQNNGTIESRIAQAAQRRVEAAGATGEDADLELVAYFIEEAVKAGINPTTPTKGPIGEWFRILWSAMTKALQKLGLVNPSKLTAQDVVDLAHGAANVAMESDATAGSAQFSRDQTRTEAFRKWFGESRVVDERGEPLVVYHGTKSDFEQFDLKKFGASDEGLAGKGFYFTYNPEEASGYALNEQFGKGDAPNVRPAYVSLQNPLVITQGVLPDGRTLKDLHGGIGINRQGGGALRKLADDGGHDGVIWASRDGQVRHVVAFRPEQIKSATGNNGAFDPNDARIQFSKAMPDWLAQMPPEAQEAARKAGVWVQQKSLKERLKDIRATAMKRVQQGLVDQFAPLKELGDREYILARLTKSSDAPLESLLLYGKPFLNDAGAIDVNLERGGLIGALQKLDGEHDRFFAWIAGNRAEQLKAEGRENLFTDDDITALKDLNQGTLPDGSSRAARFNAAKMQFSSYSKAVLDIAEKAGIISAEDRAIWEKDFYVPFYRAMEDGEFKGPRNVSGLVNQYAFKQLKGGTDNLNDLMQNTLRNWSHLLSASLKNQAAAAALEKAEAAGVATPISQKQKGSVSYLGRVTRKIPKGQSYVDNGVQKVSDGTAEIETIGEKHFMVDDPFILNAITSLEWAGWNNPAMKLMQKAKHYLTLGVTISPTFKIRNLMRDQISAIGLNPVSANLLQNLSQGWKGTDKESAQYAKMLAGGGLMRFGTFLEDDRAEHMKRLIDAGVASSTILNTPAKVKAALGKAWDWWQDVGDRSENITRAAIYQQRFDQLVKEGKSADEAHLLASFAARDSMDFSLQGQWGSIRFLTQLVPFLNARLQGLYKLGREGVAPSVRLLTGNAQMGDKERAMRFGATVGAVSLASMALLLAYQDDDDWKRREEWDRDGFWWFKIGDTAYRIPKPFEIGAIGTLAERGLETAMNGFDAESRRIFGARMWDMLMNTFSMNPIPQLFKPAIDLYANTDSFTGRPIETMGMERLSKSERIGPGTSATAQLLGKATSLVGLSPVQVDHLIDAYFSWLGSHLVMTADFALRPLMGLPDQPARKWPDGYFVVGDFAKDLPSQQSKYVTQFYEQSKKVQEVMADIRYYQSLGQYEKAAELQQDNADKVRLYGLYQTGQKQISSINKQIKFVQMSSKDADQKRDEIDRLTQARNRIAESIETRRAALQ